MNGRVLLPGGVIEFVMLERPPNPPRRARRIELHARERPLVMAIINVTPDSFSDGGQFADAAHAVAHAKRLAADGADILDVGAESTRPYAGMKRIGFDEE